MISVIDIGTNTIRAVKSDRFRELLNVSERSAILENTKDGILTSEGIVDLTQKLASLIDKIGTMPFAFATSAFRSLENREEVRTYIKELLGLDIDILSGEAEAECDYLSMKRKIDEASGIGADLGGGSCQLFAFDDKLRECKSLPIGVKRLQQRFVSGIIPNVAERGRIHNYLKEETDFAPNSDILYVTGGTARAILKLSRTLTGKEKARFTVGEFKELADATLDNRLLPTIKTVLPKRYDSIGIGIDVFCLIADKINASNIEIVDCSVREGYIIKKI